MIKLNWLDQSFQCYRNCRQLLPMLLRHFVDLIARGEVCGRERDVLREASVHQVGVPRGQNCGVVVLQHNHGALPSVQKGAVIVIPFGAPSLCAVLMSSFIAGCFDFVSDKVHMSRQLFSKRRVSALDERGLQQCQPRKSSEKATREHANARCVS